MKRKLITIFIVLMSICLFYFGGYAICRLSKVLVHSAWVINVDAYGRYHMIDVNSEDSKLACFIGWVYYPLREIEAQYHGRGGRLD